MRTSGRRRLRASTQATRASMVRSNRSSALIGGSAGVGMPRRVATSPSPSGTSTPASAMRLRTCWSRQTGSVSSAKSSSLLDQVDHRAQDAHPGVGRAAAHEPAVVVALHQVVYLEGQPGLPDARLPGDHDGGAVARPHPAPDRPQDLELGVASDDGGLVGEGPGTQAAAMAADDPVGLDRFRHAPQLQGTERDELEPPARPGPPWRCWPPRCPAPPRPAAGPRR